MTNPKRMTGAEEVRWDLSPMYKGVDDPAIDADIARLEELAKEFHGAYKGKLATELPKAFAAYIAIVEIWEKLNLFLYLSLSTDVANPLTKSKMADMEVRVSSVSGEYLTFFDIELVAIDDHVLEGLYASDPLIGKHKPWIEHQRLNKPHLLTEEVEGALAKRSPFSAGAWSDLFDELEADLRITWNGEEHNLEEMLHVLTESKDPEERASVLALINKAFDGPFAKYSAQTLYMVAGSSAVERRERGYAHPMSARNKSNRVPDAVVDALHHAVKDVAGPLARRFYRLKAAHLGLPKLRWSDRNAPMPFSDTTMIKWDDAIRTVHAAYHEFSPTLAGLIDDMVRAKRVDAPVVKGKQGGAFNYSVGLPNDFIASYVFLNYLGSARDVMTVAHEFGHGVHGLLAGKAQGSLMMHAPTAYAETASVFGEMTTFNFLKAQLAAAGDKQAQLALIMGKIDDILNTSVRQIGFSNFERRLHGMNASYTAWEEPRKLSVAELDAIWLQTAKELYGEDGDVFTYENSEHMWSYISHFHRPFYVYGYACGELLTQSLYAARPRLGERFEPLYLDMLKSGSTKDVVGLLAPFGLDPTDDTFWKNGIEVSLGAMVAEAEALSKELGISVE